MIRHMALVSAVVVIALLSLLLLALPQSKRQQATEKITKTDISETFIIQNVRILEALELTSPQSVLVRDGVIERIGEVPADEDRARVLDGAGGILLPGLIDSHTHSYGSSLADALRFGVTVNLDMFADRSLLPAARTARELRGPTREADLWSAGMLATAPGGHGTQYGVTVEPLTETSDVDGWVADRKAEGSDYIKLVYMPRAKSVPSISRDLARQVIEAAHAEGLMAVAHISTQEAARDLVEDGIDGLVHVFADTPVSDDFIDLALARGIFVIPTLAVIESIGRGLELDALIGESDRDRLLSPMQRQTLGARFGPVASSYRLDIALENVGRLYVAGVPILAGSDAPNPGTAQGLSLHRELQLLVEAGLDEAAALASATSVPASVFGLPDRGRVIEGARGDLLLLTEDPLADIAHTLSIGAVIKNGHVVPRIAGSATRSRAIATELLGDFEMTGR